ncbi:MAG TPA: hypothetical protein VL651_03520 [Bacteroidia bacterium]|nr:hypothetical protein [Bacteroidia bacterium]
MNRKLLLLPFSVFLSAFISWSCGTPPVVDVPVKKKIDTAKTVSGLKPGLIYPQHFIKIATTPFEDAHLKVNGEYFICSYKGKVEQTDSLNKNRKLLFDLKAEFMVDEIYIFKRGEGFFVNWQETDHEGVKTYFAYYKTGMNKPDWKYVEKAPSPGPPVVDNDRIYVTTLGMVGKINMDAGIFDWKLDSLFNQNNNAFKKFEAPLVYPDKVVFVDLPIPGKRTKRDTITCDPETGNRIR